VADKQIFRTGPVDAPFTYELEPSEAFQPLIIQAVLDGSGAAGPWLPAVVYVSREGHVIGRAVADSPLKAGDDAEVTWFPGVKKAPAAAVASDLPFACFVNSAPLTGFLQNIASGGDVATNISNPGFAGALFTNDLTQKYFSRTSQTQVKIKEPGQYLIIGAVQYAQPGGFKSYTYMDFDQGDGANVHQLLGVAPERGSVFTAEDTLAAFGISVRQVNIDLMYSLGADTNVRLLTNQNSGVGKFINLACLAIYRLSAPGVFNPW